MLVHNEYLTIISYNLHNHRGIHDIDRFLDIADIICLQECDTDQLPNTLGSLQLAGKTLANRQGLAIYYNPSRMQLMHHEAFPLKKSLHDRIMVPADERLLVAGFRDDNNQPFQVGCFHAAPLTASNALRRRQIHTAQQLLGALSEGTPSMLIGDYNYPLFRRGLRRMSARNGYDLSLSDKPTYLRTKLIKGHFDFLTSSGMQILNVATLPHGISDHAPISVMTRLETAPTTR